MIARRAREDNAGASALESEAPGVSKAPVDGAVPASAPAAGLTLRSVVIGLALVALTVWLVSYAELVTGQIMIGYLQAPAAAVFLLLATTLVNMLARRIAPARALKSPELATIYAMMVPAAMVASHGVLQRILPVMTAGNYFANPSNGWITTYFPHTPSWLVIWDPHGPAKQPAATRFFQGLQRGEDLPWALWIRPLAAWLSLFALVYGVFLGMATILRRQWVERERLSFPLIQLPVELIGGASTDSAAGLFGSGLAWIGFSIPMAIFTLNGLHHAWPTVPQITLTYPMSALITTPPWNGISYFMVNFSFAALGFFFLLPSDLLFSLWFFYLAGKAEEVAFSAAGNLLPSAPHADARLMIGAQTEGAWIVLVLVYLALAKPHLSAVWRGIWSRSAVDKGQGEMMSYRTAFIVVVACCAGIIAWCVAAGMSAWVAFVVFGLYLFVQAIVMARSTAEAGLIMTEGCWTPSDIISLGLPLHALGVGNLSVMSYVDAVFTRDLRSLMLTAFMDMQKLAEVVGLRLRALRSALFLSLIAAVAMGAALQIWLPYHRGANTLYSYMYAVNSTDFFRQYMPATRPGAPPPLYGAQWYALLGGAVTLALGVLRAHFSGWPLHPLAYALMGSWTVVVFWFSILIAWAFKSTILRYGGIKLYRAARPLFIGMILGELSAAAVWTLISSATGISAPVFPWP